MLPRFREEGPAPGAHRSARRGFARRGEAGVKSGRVGYSEKSGRVRVGARARLAV